MVMIMVMVVIRMVLVLLAKLDMDAIATVKTAIFDDGLSREHTIVRSWTRREWRKIRIHEMKCVK